MSALLGADGYLFAATQGFAVQPGKGDSTPPDLVVLDVSDPTAPEVAAEMLLDPMAVDLASDGTHIFVVQKPNLSEGTDALLNVFDVSHPRLPAGRRRIPLPREASAVAAHGGDALVAASNGGLDIVDIDADSGTTRSTVVGSWDVSSAVAGLVVEGGLVYLVPSGVQQDLEIVDVRDPAQPRLLSVWRGESGGPWDYYRGTAGSLAVRDGLAYIAADDEGLYIVDVTDASSPKAVSTRWAGLGSPADVDVVGSRAYLAGSETLQVLDVSEPANATEIGSIESQSSLYSVDVEGGIAYTLHQAGSVVAYEVSEPAGIVVVAAREFPAVGRIRAGEVLAVGRFVYDANRQFTILDFSVPPVARLMGEFEFPGADADAQGVALAGRQAHIAAGPGGVWVLDIDDPKHIQAIAQFDTLGDARRIAVDGGLIYVADGEGGLVTLRLDPLGQTAYLPLTVVP